MALQDPQEIPWSLIAAELGGTLSIDNARELASWREEAANEVRYQEVLSLWERTGQLGPEFPFDSQADWAQVSAKLGEASKPLWQRPIWRVAAIILILVGIGAAFWIGVRQNSSPQWNQVLAQTEEVQVDLPDGSQVTLRAGSSLRYPEAFSDDGRDVELEGEAWFEVAHDADRPFQVQGPDVQVTVLGTAFAFRDLADDESGQVDLAEGKVGVRASDSLTLIPGETALLTGDSLSKVPQSPYFLAWKTGELSFDAAPLVEVIPALSRFYEREFFMEEEADPKAQLTASFRTETVEEVQTVLEIALGVKVGVK